MVVDISMRTREEAEVRWAARHPPLQPAVLPPIGCTFGSLSATYRLDSLLHLLWPPTENPEDIIWDEAQQRFRLRDSRALWAAPTGYTYPKSQKRKKARRGT